jgi:CheY-like chemotaxis protein
LGIDYKRNTTGTGVPEQAASMQPLPDFIMIDLDLPVPDALAVARSIRAESSLAAVVLLAIGDEGWAVRAAELQAAGFAGFIAKPLPSRQLGVLLERILAGETLW